MIKKLFVLVAIGTAVFQSFCMNPAIVYDRTKLFEGNCIPGRQLIREHIAKLLFESSSLRQSDGSQSKALTKEIGEYIDTADEIHIAPLRNLLKEILGERKYFFVEGVLSCTTNYQQLITEKNQKLYKALLRGTLIRVVKKNGLCTVQEADRLEQYVRHCDDSMIDMVEPNFKEYLSRLHDIQTPTSLVNTSIGFLLKKQIEQNIQQEEQDKCNKQQAEKIAYNKRVQKLVLTGLCCLLAGVINMCVA